MGFVVELLLSLSPLFFCLVGLLLSLFPLYLRPVRESLGLWLLEAPSCPSSWTFLLGLAWIPGEG